MLDHMAHEKVYSAEFQEAVAYSLACVHQQSLTLKEKQEEEHFHLYNDQDVFAWCPGMGSQSNMCSPAKSSKCAQESSTWPQVYTG